MIRIEEITLHGFKDPNRIVNFKFSNEPVTIIYGENGCGKTTFLKCIRAILKDDIEYLKQQKISEYSVTFSLDNIKHTFAVDCDNKDYFIEDKSYTPFLDSEGNMNIIKAWEELVYKSSSILSNTNRGFIGIDGSGTSFIEYIMERVKILRYNEDNEATNRFYDFIINLLHPQEKSDKEDNHREIDVMKISEIESLLKDKYKEVRDAMFFVISKAFFETVEMNLENNFDCELPENFKEKFTKYISFFEFISKLDNDFVKFKNKINNLILNKNFEELSKEKSVFKFLIVNLLEYIEKKEEEINIFFSIENLKTAFNSFTIHNKELRIEEDKVYIKFSNNLEHSLTELSSGERHLLSFLTIFLVIGRKMDFFLIDEPEISLSMKWQRKLISLLTEFSPNSQIILATHSPDISNGKSEYLRELK